jgi:hypothetical protein
MSGRPSIISNDDDCENIVQQIDEMRRLNLSWTVIKVQLGVSRSWLLQFRQQISYIDPMAKSNITDDQLDEEISQIQSDHPDRGEVITRTNVRDRGINISRERVRTSLHRVNPDAVAYRRSTTVKRVIYHVKGPHHLWHIDGNHKMKDFGIAVEAGIDGFSRACVFMKAISVYDAMSILNLFTEGVIEYTLPSRVRTDKGTENVRIAEYMINARGSFRGSIITGRSTRNQRIERFWRDVRKEVLNFYIILFNFWVDTYYIDFNTVRVKFIIHYMFMRRINDDLANFRRVWNDHPLSTEHHQTPNQLLYLNDHLVKLAPVEVDEREYGIDDDDELDDIEPHMMTYDPVSHPFNEHQFQFFVLHNAPLSLLDVSTEHLWERTVRAFFYYDHLVEVGP